MPRNILFELFELTYLQNFFSSESTKMELSQQSNENNFDLSKCFYDDKFESLNLVRNNGKKT